MKSVIIELMTAKERSEYIEKGIQTVKKPGAKAVTFAKSKEKKGESVTVHETADFNNSLVKDIFSESLILPVGSRGVYFEQDSEDLVCLNYKSNNRTCMIGCSKVGVDKNTECPYQPIPTQPKCPCYKRS